MDIFRFAILKVWNKFLHIYAYLSLNICMVQSAAGAVENTNCFSTKW